MEGFIYLDYAASTPLDPEVEAAMLPYMRAVGNPSSIHAAGRRLRAAIEEARNTIAELIGAEPSQIIFTSGGTEADNHALRGAVESGLVSHILYNPTEHHAVLHTIEALVRQGKIKASPLLVDEKGRIILEYLETELRRHSRSLVAIMYANNEIGTLQPVKEIANLVKEHGGYYLCDTVQVMGLGWVSVSDWPVDFIAASAHKFYGPKGVGFLYRRHPIQSLITGGAQEREQRAGTENVAGIVGMAHALRKAYENREAYESHLRNLKQFLLTVLSQRLPGAILHGDTSVEGGHPGILNFRLPSSIADEMLVIHLDLAGICVSGTSACASGSGHPSHVLQAIGVSPEEAQRAIRLSWGKQTEPAHLEATISALTSALQITI
ncbi:MAG: cysteine desulfurase family protein [Bacteroidia bacterium]|nr:cysteine desulfurase [Bacteroidia bacterium]MDW8134960.1 cysteine desulfurase family protein [Bacteroidia bacterium]